MKLDTDSLCMGCMTPSQGNGTCPRCGYDEENDPPAPHHLPPRTILNGKYMTGSVLGEGGFGITYIGIDLNLELRIAIKEYYPTGFVTRESTTTNTVTPYKGEPGQFFSKGRERFIDEARSLAKFRSLPGIVAVNDFFLENGTAYIVMEYIDGQTFKSYLAKMGGKLPVGQVFEMMRPVFDSLREVHSGGMIHRDISPDNLMITHGGFVKLLDFGAARDFADSGNKSLSVMLKPGYAPEEQYRSRGVQGPWTDIYALCATVYRCITGITPDEANERMRQDRVEKPSSLGIAIDPARENALMRGMSVLQENRFRTMDELSAALYPSDNAKAQPSPQPQPNNPIPVPAPPASTYSHKTNGSLGKKVLLAGACVLFTIFAVSYYSSSNSKSDDSYVNVSSNTAASSEPIINSPTANVPPLSEAPQQSETPPKTEPSKQSEPQSKSEADPPPASSRQKVNYANFLMGSNSITAAYSGFNFTFNINDGANYLSFFVDGIDGAGTYTEADALNGGSDLGIVLMLNYGASAYAAGKPFGLAYPNSSFEIKITKWKEDGITEGYFEGELDNGAGVFTTLTDGYFIIED